MSSVTQKEKLLKDIFKSEAPALGKNKKELEFEM